MDTQLEELIREIAAKHGIAVARDDPILVLQTINNRLLRDSAAAQQAQLNQFKEEMEGVALRWQVDSKEKAERILNFALAASKEAMHQALADGASEACEQIRQVLADANDQASRHALLARRAALFNFASTCLLMLMLLVAMFWLQV